MKLNIKNVTTYNDKEERRKKPMNPNFLKRINLQQNSSFLALMSLNSRAYFIILINQYIVNLLI